MPANKLEFPCSGEGEACPALADGALRMSRQRSPRACTLAHTRTRSYNSHSDPRTARSAHSRAARSRPFLPHPHVVSLPLAGSSRAPALSSAPSRTRRRRRRGPVALAATDFANHGHLARPPRPAPLALSPGILCVFPQPGNAPLAAPSLRDAGARFLSSWVPLGAPGASARSAHCAQPSGPTGARCLGTHNHLVVPWF